LAGDGAQGGEFRSRKGNFVGATRFWIGEGFQSGKGRVRWYGDFATEKRELGHVWRISKMLGERKSLGVSVVASFPRKSATKSLKP